ncbi:hypothetical protein AB0A63_11045, partial [Lentzea sp. NPDC042327]|uniref:hypothetical protein n=1 Tax=Lentzea sp. NPDC042327 TaxID=3154801 RepID=UPI0033C72FD0
MIRELITPSSHRLVCLRCDLEVAGVPSFHCRRTRRSPALPVHNGFFSVEERSMTVNRRRLLLGSAALLAGTA